MLITVLVVSAIIKLCKIFVNTFFSFITIYFNLLFLWENISGKGIVFILKDEFDDFRCFYLLFDAFPVVRAS